jgi:signal transduction histidine kinase
MVMDTLISRLLTADESRVLPEVWERRLVAGFDTLTSDQERLEKILQLRRETLYFILHDLRNPLGLAITALAMIELEGDDPRTHNARQFLATAESGLSRVLLLVESLLDVERLDQGEVRLDLEPADLVGLVERTVTLLQPMAATSRIDLRADLPAAGLPAIPLDRARLERVLVNLIDNALRFTPPGGVITVRARQEGDRLVVSVNDTGRGIPPQQRERVFDRFAQVEEVPTTGGFGMGLAYCRSAVAAHGGEIRAEEGDGGVGAKIVFWLPL